MSVGVLVLGCLAVLVAAFTMSLTGFGFALVAAPLLLFLFEPKTVVIVNVILGAIICLLILGQSRRHVKAGRTALLAAGSIFGIPLGAYILSHAPVSVLRMLMAALVVIFAVPLALGHSHRFKREGLGSTISGFVSGMLASSTSLSGPPVVLFLLNQGWERESFRATLAIYFLFCSLMALIAIGLSGFLTSDLLVTVSTFVPAVLLGFYLGTRVAPRVNTTLFRRISILVVLLAGLLGVATSLPALL
ncbi:MAG: sulfite exporter TauE/SafE family protein [Chloroflexi bacterium]|nr:sulfite exporter TauE/SafE family protein [Chloroflexota bacterium]